GLPFSSDRDPALKRWASVMEKTLNRYTREACGHCGPTEEKFDFLHAHLGGVLRNGDGKDQIDMRLKERIEQKGATGYILLWLLGIPIPILFLFFLLRGCT